MNHAESGAIFSTPPLAKSMPALWQPLARTGILSMKALFTKLRHVFVKQPEALGHRVLTPETPDPVNPPSQLFKIAKAESRKFQLYPGALMRQLSR